MNPRQNNAGDPAGKPPSAQPGAAAPLSVGELSRRILRLLEGEIGQVCVVGEVSNLRTPASGHGYFLLKDAEAAIHAVCFRGTLGRQPVRLRDGLRLEVRGRVTAYTPRSEYQLVVEAMREAGLGELMRRFLDLKEKLKAAGLFDAERKRPIPRLPRRIGIVTSPTGAVLRDMLNILRRRARGLTIYLSPATVQGENAPGEIVAAIERLRRHGRSEVIVVGRGGGSIEDLWAFNDERVVRAIAACALPVISAVGHETDTTLADYAADLRAPTPSAAAELVSAHYGELAEQVAQLGRRLGRCLQYRLAERRNRLARCLGSWGLRKPAERLNLAMQRLDDLNEALGTLTRRLPRRRAERLADLGARLARANPQSRVANLRARLVRAESGLAAAGPARWTPRLAISTHQLEQLRGRLRLVAAAHGQRRALRLKALSQRLAGVSPEAILKRGYSIVTRGKRRRIVTDPAQVKVGEIVYVRSAGGPWRAVALPESEDLFDQVEQNV